MAIFRGKMVLEPIFPLRLILYIVIARCASLTHGIRSACLTAANSVEPSDARDGDLLPRKVKGTLALDVWCPENDRVLSFKTNPYVMR